MLIVVVLPLLWHQLITLYNELPGMLAKWQSLLLLLPERYPHLVSDEQVLQAIEVARGEIGKFGQWALTGRALTGRAATQWQGVDWQGGDGRVSQKRVTTVMLK